MAGDGTSRATVIKIARAIIILKPAFLVPRSTGAWSLPSPGGGGRRRLNGEGRGREVGEKGSSVGGNVSGCIIYVYMYPVVLLSLLFIIAPSLKYNFFSIQKKKSIYFYVDSNKFPGNMHKNSEKNFWTTLPGTLSSALYVIKFN